MQVLPRTRPDQVLTEHLSQLSLVELELARAQKDYAPAHPLYIRVLGQVSELKQKVDQDVKAIMIAFDVEVDRLDSEVTGLKKAVTDAQALDIEKAQKSRPYFDKKRELEGLFGFSRILETKVHVVSSTLHEAAIGGR